MTNITKALRIRFRNDKELNLKFFHYDAGQIEQFSAAMRQARKKTNRFLANIAHTIRSHVPSIDRLKIIDKVPFEYLGKKQVREGRERYTIEQWQCQICGAVKEDPYVHAYFHNRNGDLDEQ